MKKPVKKPVKKPIRAPMLKYKTITIKLTGTTPLIQHQFNPTALLGCVRFAKPSECKCKCKCK